ncbi:MAG TPA: hypothetical protein VFH27_15495 [Longimicrobiaceae bacterium]|nr:hypothetical protein [Longimicrobiaceae bacterium]
MSTCTCDTFTGTVKGAFLDKRGAVLNAQHPDFGGNLATALSLAYAGEVIVLPSRDLSGGVLSYTTTTGFSISTKVAIQGNAIGHGGSVAAVDGTIISGTNLSIATASVPFKMDSVCIKESGSSGSAGTIALNIDNSSGGVNNWVLRDIYLTGTTNKLGVGLRCYFALKGVVYGGHIEGWEHGVLLKLTSNANLFVGSKFRLNDIGVYAPDQESAPNAGDQSCDDVFLQGCVLEGNNVGVQAMSGAITLQSCHLENVYTGTNVILGGTASLKSTGCDYGGSAKDIEILAGNAQNHSSVGDTFRGGGGGTNPYSITHNGTGVLRIVNPTMGLPTITGSGPVIVEFENVIYGYQCTGRDLKVEGFATVYSATNGQGFTAHATGGVRYRIVPPNNSGGNAFWITPV